MVKLALYLTKHYSMKTWVGGCMHVEPRFLNLHIS
jgi:hypothetical protein